MKNTIETPIEKARKTAMQNGGVCISEKFFGKECKLRWECKNNHTWDASYKHVVYRGTWCAICAGNKLENGLKTMQDFAQEKQGKCISKIYASTRTLMEWECKSGHIWQATFKTAKQSWCTACVARPKQDPMVKARQVAKQRSGTCLNNTYINSRQPMDWKCAQGHTWTAKYSNVVSAGSWCPTCKHGKYKSEGNVRMILETFFGFSLPTKRPKWNRNPLTKRALELDGYNEKFRIAFEHDGEHHHSNHRSKTEIGYRLQIYRDFVKRINCQKNGITLITIPIVASNMRGNFFRVLRNVIECCKPYGTILTFTLTQLRTMKRNLV